MPRILDELTEVLRGTGEEGVVAERTSISGRHGRQRFRLGFDIEAVVHEYALLHRCIIDVVREEGVVVPFDEQRVMSDFISNRLPMQSRSTAASVTLSWSRNRTSISPSWRTSCATRSPPCSSRSARRWERSSCRRPPWETSWSAVSPGFDSLIEGALELAVAREGIEPHVARLRVSTLVTEAIAESELAAGYKEIRFETRGEEDLEIDADPRLMRSALTNLLGNAVKFSQRGGRVGVRFRKRNGMVQIEVEDACGGLPPGSAEKMFKPFVQVGEDKSGFGLGLAIARQAVEAQGGKLGVRDRPGEGCTMTMELPQGAAGVERGGRA